MRLPIRLCAVILVALITDCRLVSAEEPRVLQPHAVIPMEEALDGFRVQQLLTLSPDAKLLVLKATKSKVKFPLARLLLNLTYGLPNNDQHDERLYVLDLETGREVFFQNNAASLIASLSRDGKRFAVREGEEIALWNLVDARPRKPVRLRRNPSDYVTKSKSAEQAEAASAFLLGSGSRLSFAPDSKTLAAVDGEVVLWDLAANDVLTTLKSPHGAIMAATFSPDGKWIATLSASVTTKKADSKIFLEEFETQILLWEAATHTVSAAICTDQNRYYGELKFSADSQALTYLTFGLEERQARMFVKTTTRKRWDHATLEERTIWTRPTVEFKLFEPEPGLPNFLLTARTQGNWYATAGDEGVVKLWDDDADKLAAIFRVGEVRVGGLTLSDDAQTLVTVNDLSNELRLWKLPADPAVSK